MDAASSSSSSGASDLKSSNASDLKYSTSVSTRRSSFRPRRASVLSHTSSVKRGQCEVCTDNRMEEMEMSIDRPELLEAATKIKGLKARFGKKINGDFNYLLEIIFADETSWFARIPKLWRSSHPEQTMYAELSAYRYLKLHSKIQVPEVYGYGLQSDTANAVGVSYMLIEKMRGTSVPELSMGSKEGDVERAKRFHGQLADIILELASFKFDKIGSIHESTTTPGTFEIGPLYDFYTTYPLPRGHTSFNRGPYSSAVEYYTAISDLNTASAVATASTPLDLELARLELLRKMIPKFTETNNTGPFVLQNWKLSSDNILVDNDCNITAVLSFNGVVGPLQNLARYPSLIYQTEMRGPLFERRKFADVYVNRIAPEGSLLSDQQLRADLMKKAHKTWMYENSLLYPAHKTLHLADQGGLYEYVFSQPSESTLLSKTTFPDIPKTHENCTKYSWQLPDANVKKNKSSAGHGKKHHSKIRDSWVKTREDDTRVREYVRVHKHLPPDVKAEPGRKRNNGPEKAFYMAWKFIKCR